MNLTDQEIEKLKATQSEEEWNAMCDEIKRARNGQFPPDWWQEMALSGLMARIAKSWTKL